MDLITAISTGTPASPTVNSQSAAIPKKTVIKEIPEDKVEISKTKSDVQPPEISSWRLFTGVLKDEQIKAINESKMLPKNAKFEFGGKIIANNRFNITTGTQKLLPGYEVRRNIFGFVSVVPEGSKGFFLKELPE